MDMQTITMQLIVNSGDARSKAMEAIGSAKSGKFSEAKELLEQAEKSLTAAHEFQTEIIQEEANGNIKNVSVILIHAQDHLMNAITIIDMAHEFVDLYELFLNKK